VFHRGSSAAQNSKTSVTSRIDGRGGKMYVPRAMYSLRMSFCVVPLMRARSSPWASAAATYSASRIGAVALIVIDVLTSPSGRPSTRTAMSARLLIGTPTRPTSPSAAGASES
jgi:hypothetical protein